MPSLPETTYGLLPCVVEHVRGNVNGLALNLVCPSTVVAQAGGDGTNISLGHGDGLAVIERLNSSEHVEVLLGEISKLEEHGAAGLGSGLLPGTVEGLACGGYSEVDILLGGFADGADDLLC